MNKINKINMIVCVCSLALFFNCLVGINETANAQTIEEQVEHRQEIMKGYGKSMRIIAGMMRGKIDYAAESLSNAANFIVENSDEVATQFFVKDSITEDSEASPVIWQDWNAFSALMHDVGFYANALAHSSNNTRANGKDEVAMLDDAEKRDLVFLSKQSPDVNFMLMAGTCGACHKAFRIKKD